MGNSLQNQRLAELLKTEQKILNAQKYSIGNRTVERAQLSQVQSQINELIAAGATVDGFENRKSRTLRVILRD